MRSLQNPAVKEAFDAFPVEIRRKFLVLRKLILDVALATKGVGAIEETVKWGVHHIAAQKWQRHSLCGVFIGDRVINRAIQMRNRRFVFKISYPLLPSGE
jgi:hypothetical protein